MQLKKHAAVLLENSVSEAMASSDGRRIMVFRPTPSEFANFSAYIRKIEKQGAHKAGVAKARTRHLLLV